MALSQAGFGAVGRSPFAALGAGTVQVVSSGSAKDVHLLCGCNCLSCSCSCCASLNDQASVYASVSSNSCEWKLTTGA